MRKQLLNIIVSIEGIDKEVVLDDELRWTTTKSMHKKIQNHNLGHCGPNCKLIQ